MMTGIGKPPAAQNGWWNLKSWAGLGWAGLVGLVLNTVQAQARIHQGYIKEVLHERRPRWCERLFD
jgi:hypothetical protein